jgi:hypothetical protein
MYLLMLLGPQDNSSRVALMSQIGKSSQRHQF